MAIKSTDFETLNKVISGYTDEEYTRAKKLTSTAIVGSDAQINTSGEDFIGQVRFYKPLGAYLEGATGGTESQSVSGSANAVVNIATQNEDYGRTTNISTETNTYIKTVRTHGANEYLVQSVISQESGIGKIARDFSETRAEDEDQSIRAILQGVVASESGMAAPTGTPTIRDFWQGNQPDSVDNSNRFGYIAAAGTFLDKVPAAYNASNNALQPLIGTSRAIGSAATNINHLIMAMGAWSDYNPPFVYLVVSPGTYLAIKSNNIIDTERVTDGNITFETILSGTIRLIVTRSVGQEVTGAASGIFTGSTGKVKTSYMILPGSVYESSLSVPNPVAVDRNESVGAGSGRTTAWYRWGYVMHPRGYSFTGTQTAFASGATYKAAASWERTSDILNLGILPIFHG